MISKDIRDYMTSNPWPLPLLLANVLTCVRNDSQDLRDCMTSVPHFLSNVLTSVEPHVPVSAYTFQRPVAIESKVRPAWTSIDIVLSIF